MRPIVVWNTAVLETLPLGCDLRRRPLSLAMSRTRVRQVWRSGKPLWSTRNVLRVNPHHPCALAAVSLQAGVWFALKTDRGVNAVIELRCLAVGSEMPPSLPALERLGLHLGQAIEALRRPSPPGSGRLLAPQPEARCS